MFLPSLHVSIETAITSCTIATHDINPGHGALPEWRAGAFYHRGLLYLLSGKNDPAIADFTTAISWKHDHGAAYEARGDAYQDVGQSEKAAADYAAAARLESDQPLALSARCWIRAVRGYPLDRALVECNDALKEEPDDEQILLHRCLVYYKMGNYAAAVADCGSAEKSHRRFDEALYIGGLAKLKLGDTTGGNADIDAALDADYRIADLYVLYGVKR